MIKPIIFTSYYAKLRTGYLNNPISISLYLPRGINLPEYRPLAPSENILSRWKRNHDVDEYIERYTEQLSRLDPLLVVNSLSEIYHSYECTLLCYERPDSFCHRHLVRQWLNDNGYICHEVRFSK